MFAAAVAGLATGYSIGVPVGFNQLPCVLEPVPAKSALVVAPSPSIQITITSSVVAADTPGAPAGPWLMYKSSNAPERWKFQHGPHHVADTSTYTVYP